jgi:lipopolysaccharide/colanic/teichoic acid biosynthesis glycosyltransferase
MPRENVPMHPASAWANSRSRRIFDIGVAGIAVALLSPLLVLIAAAIRLTSPGPAIFRQKRVGRHGHDFIIFKFRTMRCDLDGCDRSSSGDRRITPLGRILRRHKMDELPQLFNVLRGDMCLVGPRPKLRGHHSEDLQFRPGLTGAASVAFATEEILLRHVQQEDLEDVHQRIITPRKLQLDLAYMAKATLRSDLRLLVMTLLREGQYSSLEQVTGSGTTIDTAHEAKMVSDSSRGIYRPAFPFQTLSDLDGRLAGRAANGDL